MIGICPSCKQKHLIIIPERGSFTGDDTVEFPMYCRKCEIEYVAVFKLLPVNNKVKG